MMLLMNDASNNFPFVWKLIAGDGASLPPAASQGLRERDQWSRKRRARRRDPGWDRWGRAVRLSRAAGKREMRAQAARQLAAGRSGRSRTFLTPGRGSNASRQTASHPGIRRHSAASAGTAVSSAAQKRQTSGDDGDASAVRWELPATVLGALAQRSSSARTGSADVP